jgi:hypothetical protein
MTPNESNHNLYIIIKTRRCVIIILYVHDLMFMGDHTSELLFLEDNLKNGLKCLNLE